MAMRVHVQIRGVISLNRHGRGNESNILWPTYFIGNLLTQKRKGCTMWQTERQRFRRPPQFSGVNLYQEQRFLAMGLKRNNVPVNLNVCQ
jgi:hypothetical protein